jgi:hypothetical protein
MQNSRYIPIPEAEHKCRKIIPVEVLAKARQLHQRFTDEVLPAVERHARKAFRLWPDRKQEDATQEARAIAWRDVLRIMQNHPERDPLAFPGMIAKCAVKQIRAFRTLAGKQRVKDAMSERARHQRGINIAYKSMDYLTERHQGDPAEHVAFVIDFQEWRRSLSSTTATIVDELAICNNANEVARTLHIDPRRLKEIRKDAAADYAEWMDEGA